MLDNVEVFRIAKFEGKEEARYAGVNILHHGMIMKQK